MALQHNTIEYTHGGNTFEARVAWDDAVSGPRPGVLIGHAWGGRSNFEDDKAEAIAQLGYVGFALDVYGKGRRGNNADENTALMQPLLEDRAQLQARLASAQATLGGLADVDASRIAIMGYCFGGLCALDLARTGADIKAAVCIHGLFGAPDNHAKTPIRARILAQHGWDDPMAKPDSVLALAQELSTKQADWQLHAYGNTMHAFTNPEANDPDFGTVYSAAADQRSWQSLVNFLAECFAD